MVDARDIINKRIRDGIYSLRLNEQKYAEHVQGTPQYINTTKTRGREPSRLFLSYEEAQDLIELYSGKGDVLILINGKVGDIEFAETDMIIGEYQEKEIWKKTRRFGIYHGKNGSHIVPVKER